MQTETKSANHTINYSLPHPPFQVIIPPKQAPKPNETISGTEETSHELKRRKPKKLKNPKKSLRLVSYNDDTIVSDEEGMEESAEDEEEEDEDDDEDAESSMGLGESVSQSADTGDAAKTEDGSAVDSERDSRMEERWAKYEFSLPPEPKGKCAVELQDKINLLYEKMKNTNMDMNRVIQERKEFRNPSIYEKLIQFCDINEFGTNYPPEIYDPLQWGPESYYEELAKAQKVEMDRREKEKKDTSKVDQAKKVEEEAKRRKSKWDQPGPGSATAAASTVSATTGSGSIKPALTTNITGTKGTVISAFGSLPKKPKV